MTMVVTCWVASAEIGVKRGKGAAQFAQSGRLKPGIAPLRYMRIPTAHIQTGDFQPDVALEQTRRLPQPVAKIVGGIRHPNRGLIMRRVQLPNGIHRQQSFLPRALQRIRRLRFIRRGIQPT